MKAIYKKKLEKAAHSIREVYDALETEGKKDFDDYGERLDALAVEIDDFLEDVELNSNEEDVDDSFQIE